MGGAESPAQAAGLPHFESSGAAKKVVLRGAGFFVHQFASGWKRNYYGKGDVIAYRLNRDGRSAAGASPVFGANITMLVYGDAFWPTYTTGDNTGLVATDSMKNFVQREMLDYEGSDLEDCCRFLATKFLDTYPQVEGLQVSAVEIPYAALPGSAQAFVPAGPDRATARLEINRDGIVEIASGVCGFRLLRLGGSAFHGFVRDGYTTLPDTANRPLHMWLDLEWLYTQAADGFSSGAVTAAVRRIVRGVFDAFESGSIQQVIYQIGTKMLSDIPGISEVHLEANNRTWDTVAERGEELGVYTEARPPFGCLGLRLRR
ncbi:MAG: factor-independent urate hydroxylase [Bryobacteraceae bacterium]|jgi:urate oxidase